MESRSVLIVDDHDEFRRFARMLLEADGFVVTGEAADGESAVDAAREQMPDVVLLDVQLPDIDGFEVARLLAAQTSAPEVVMTSSRQASDYGHKLTEAPISGFLPKQNLSAAEVAAVLARAGT